MIINFNTEMLVLINIMLLKKTNGELNKRPQSLVRKHIGQRDFETHFAFMQQIVTYTVMYILSLCPLRDFRRVTSLKREAFN